MHAHLQRSKSLKKPAGGNGGGGGRGREEDDTNEEDDDEDEVVAALAGRRGGGGGGEGGVYVFDPYNPRNVQITEPDVVRILAEYGVRPDRFRICNFGLFRRAFVHRSYVKHPDLENLQNNVHIVERPPNCLPLFKKSNERLEFVGDGVLELVAKFYLYRRFPRENEGFMTEKKIALVKNEAIGRIALEMGLHRWLVLSNHAEQKQTRTNLKKLGCLFEAFVGALFLEANKVRIRDDDGWFDHSGGGGGGGGVFITGPGFQVVQIFIEAIFEKHVNWTNVLHNDDNYKNILQVIIQKEFKVTPEYCILEEPHHQQHEFVMGVFLVLRRHHHHHHQPHQHLQHHADAAQSLHEFRTMSELHSSRGAVLLGRGAHRNKKKAEQLACKNAITLLTHLRGGGSSGAEI